MRSYKVVDVFSCQPFRGNPVAVVLDAEDLSDDEMQSIASWINLSETTFILPAGNPQADYRVRIFTPRSELPFAGHPTLGSAHAMLEAGRVMPKKDMIIQECGLGLVQLGIQGGGKERRIVLQLPPATARPLTTDDVTGLEAVIDASIVREAAPMIVDVGAVWILAQLANPNSLLALVPDFARSARLELRLGATGLSLFAEYPDGEVAIEVRSFAPSNGVDEDPVCGSGNGSIAVFRSIKGMIPAEGVRYLAGQGRKLGRDGRVAVSVDATGEVSIGGSCITCISGTVHGC